MCESLRIKHFNGSKNDESIPLRARKRKLAVREVSWSRSRIVNHVLAAAMSDLNDFFAKKDKKNKKKPKASTAGGSSGEKGSAQSDKPVVNGAVLPKASGSVAGRKDDGWIEIDESKTAIVNTGGRTVADFNKREADEKEAALSGDAPAEKFSGWTGDSKTTANEEEGDDEAPTEVGAAPAASYPSLADTANAPEVPKNSGPGGGGYVSRNKYSSNNPGFAALKAKLEAMRASDGTPASGGAAPASASAYSAQSGPTSLKELATMKRDAAK